MSESKDHSVPALSKRQQRRQAARKYVYRAPTLADRLATLSQHAAALKHSAVAAQIRAGLDAYFDAVKLDSAEKSESLPETKNTNGSGAEPALQKPAPSLRIRCLALGSPTESGIAMYQLALLMLIAEWFSPSRCAARQQEKEQNQQQQQKEEQETKATVENLAKSDEDKPQGIEKTSGSGSADPDTSASITSSTPGESNSSGNSKKKKKKSKEIKLTQLTPTSGPGAPAPSYTSLSSYTPAAAPSSLSSDPNNASAWKLPLDVAVTTYDPVFSPDDHELFEALGIKVSEDHGFVDAEATATTIVYSIHAPPFLTESVLAATTPSDPARYVYIGNVLENYGTHLSTAELQTRYPLINAAVVSSPFPSTRPEARKKQQSTPEPETDTALVPWTWFPVPDSLSANEPWMTAVNDLCVYWRNPHAQHKSPVSLD